MAVRGSYCGAGREWPFFSARPRQRRSPARWSRRAVIPSPRSRHAAIAALTILAFSWLGAPSARAEAPSNYSRSSSSGSYLAARHAGTQKDAAAAAAYYRSALRGDPRNNELLSRTFLAVLANGEIDEAVKLAERVIQIDKT